ncbi:MAG: hypothetical protein EBY35_15985 [Rhodobacteraceae bacterium]|nr:hypothetical protein [Paracoccaceae bacterium]
MFNSAYSILFADGKRVLKKQKNAPKFQRVPVYRSVLVYFIRPRKLMTSDGTKLFGCAGCPTHHGSPKFLCDGLCLTI